MSTDEGYGVAPPGVEAPGADAEALAEGTVRRAAGPPAVEPLGRTVAIDFAERRLIPGTAGGPLTIRGLATLAQWIDKCLRTPRGGAAAVDPQFGVDVLPHEVFDGGAFDMETAQDAVADWRTALEYHPRIVSIEDMRMDGDPSSDAATLTFRVVMEGGGILNYEASVDAGGLTPARG